GEITDLNQRGVKAIDDKTLEITLENATPDFLNALMHYTAYPLPKHVVEAKGQDWVNIGILGCILRVDEALEGEDEVSCR
ncbi:hypothetical protein ACCT04_36600, partial [Rhizobium ruizarguesonis]